MPVLTVGMATFRNFSGVYQTIDAIRIHHILGIKRAGWDLELVVVDNDADGPHSERVRRFLATISSAAKAGSHPSYSGFPQPIRARYEPLKEPVGTAPPRNRVFEIASGDAILCVDDHINFMPGSLERFCRWVDANPDCKDLIQGPMMLDNLIGFHTHFDPPFRDGMWGTWGTDEERASYNDKEWESIEVPSKPPFEITAQGLGVFGCLKGQWLGFNPHFREFGGEEWYIHEKYRLAGRKAICLPFLRWPHKFDDPAGRHYRASSVAKVRNYVLGAIENGMPLDRIYNHFVLRKNESDTNVSKDSGVTEEVWNAIVSDPERYPVDVTRSRTSPVKSKKGCCSAPVENSAIAISPKPKSEEPAAMQPGLEKRFARMSAEPGDWNSHAARVREKIRGYDTIIEVAPMASVLSVAIAVDPGKVIHHWYDQGSGIATIIAGKTPATYRPYQEGVTGALGVIHGYVDPQPLRQRVGHLAKIVDRLLIFIKPNSVQTGEAERIVFKGDGGKPRATPGVMPMIRTIVAQNPEWNVVETHLAREGWILLSRRPEDRKKIKPGLITQGISLLKAKIEHKRKDGGRFLTPEEAEPRFNACALCEARVDSRCSECGCYLFGTETDPGKIYYPSQFCPVAKWGPVQLADDGGPKPGSPAGNAGEPAPDIGTTPDDPSAVQPVEPAESDAERS